MTNDGLMDALHQGIPKANAISIDKFPIKSLSLPKNEIQKAMLDVRQIKTISMKEPIEIMYDIQPGQFIVVNVPDDYYRVINFIAKKAHLIPVKIWSSFYSAGPKIPSQDLFFKPVPINSFVHSFSILKEIYHDKQSDDEKTKNAELYFSIGQEGPNSVTDKNYCWIWDGNNVLSKMGATHGLNFSHQVANRNFKGWYDAAKNIISVVFPEHELRKLGDRRPTEDDIPQYLYQKLISQFGKRKPRFVVFESKRCGMSKKDLKLFLKEIVQQVLEPEDSLEEIPYDKPYGGWLDPDLNFHEVEVEGHRSWALTYLKTNTPKKQFSVEETTYDKMYKLGFIRVIISGDTLYYEYEEGHPPAPRKIKALKDFAVEYRCTFIKDDRTKKIEDLLQESILESPVNIIVNETMFPKEFNRHTLGSCLGATALATYYLLKKGISDFKIVEGWVYFPHFYDEDDEDNWSAHTWIEFPNGRKFDPTRKQWKEWGFDPDKGEVKYVTIKINRTYTPEEYQKVCLKDTSLKFIHKKKISENLKSLEETMTYKELLGLTTDDRKERAANVNVRSIPVSVEEGQEHWNFRYKSNPQTTVTDEPFEGHIIFLKGEVEQGDNAMDLECKVDCGCPDFMYRFAYNDTQKGASDVGPDSLSGCANRRPKPAYDFGEGLCKHLAALSRYLRTKISATKKSNLFEAVSDVAKQGPFNVTYYDD